MPDPSQHVEPVLHEAGSTLASTIPVVRHGVTAYKVAREALKLRSPAFGSVELSLFMVMDFKDPIRIDEWTINKNKMIHSMNAILHDGKFTIQNELKNVEIVPQEFFHIPGLDENIESITDIIDEEDEHDLGKGLLFVKRVNVFAIPYSSDKNSFLKAILSLAKYEENFTSILDLKKSFIGVKLHFTEQDLRKNFSTNIFKKATNENFGSDDFKIDEHDKTIKIIYTKLARTDRFFEIIGYELYKNKFRYYVDPLLKR